MGESSTCLLLSSPYLNWGSHAEAGVFVDYGVGWLSMASRAAKLFLLWAIRTLIGGPPAASFLAGP